MEVNFLQSRIRGFAKYDLQYFIPFFTRRFTQEVSYNIILSGNPTYIIVSNFNEICK